MKANKKIAIIGHFGGHEYLTDGQTVKTKVLYDELLNATDWKVIKVDTYYKKRRPLKLFIDSIFAVLFIRDVIVLLSGNGLKVYSPLLYWASKYLHTRVYHDVIGGNLDGYLNKNPKYIFFLNSFTVNWVETDHLKKQLENCGVENCEVIPNFKRLSILSLEEICSVEREPMHFCTFSRVMKEKGIEDAVTAIEAINLVAKKTRCTLDIYGLIDNGYKNRFEELMKEVSGAVQYKGIIPFDKSVEAIKGYTALLFPTHWSGEGFPGTVIDAFSAGLPVIATDWNCNSEIIDNGSTGIIYSNIEKKGLQKSIEEYLEYSDVDRYEMKKRCLAKAEEYSPSKWIRIIVRRIEAERG